MQQVFFTMTKSRILAFFEQWLVRAVTKCWLLAVLLTFGALAAAQTAVVLAPVPQLQFFDPSGRPVTVRSGGGEKDLQMGQRCRMLGLSNTAVSSSKMNGPENPW